MENGAQLSGSYLKKKSFQINPSYSNNNLFQIEEVLKNLEKYQDSEDTDSKGKKPRREGLARKAMLKWVKHKQTKSDGAPAALDVTVRCLTFFYIYYIECLMLNI